MKIAIGCDHRGFHLKEKVRELLISKGYTVEDAGTMNGTDPVDYPDYGKVVASKVSKGEVDRGILICGTGIGMALTANKHHGGPRRNVPRRDHRRDQPAAQRPERPLPLR